MATNKATEPATPNEAEAPVAEAEAEAEAMTVRSVNLTDDVGGGLTIQGILTGLAKYTEAVGVAKGAQFTGQCEAMDELRTLFLASWTDAKNTAMAIDLANDLKVSTWVAGLKAKVEATGSKWNTAWKAATIETAVTIWGEHVAGGTDAVFTLACGPLVPKGQKRLVRDFNVYVDFLRHYAVKHYDDNGHFTPEGAAWYAAKAIMDKAKGQFMFDPDRVLAEDGDDEEAIITNAFKLANDIRALARIRAAKSADYKGIESKVRSAAK